MQNHLKKGSRKRLREGEEEEEEEEIEAEETPSLVDSPAFTDTVVGASSVSTHRQGQSPSLSSYSSFSFFFLFFKY